jgi:hypothetical protein
MPLSDTPLNEEIFDRVRWQECQRYSQVFLSKVRRAEDAGDKEAQEAFAVLRGLTSMMLNADSREEPFSPMMVLSTGRSAAGLHRQPSRCLEEGDGRGHGPRAARQYLRRLGLRSSPNWSRRPS